MHRELKVKTPSLAGSTELVVMAPIKSGFVPTLDSVTYKTRAKLLLSTLHAGRQGSHEHRLLRVLSDAVERVGAIHTVRVAVIEPEDKILLSVNFDGAYEAYVRVIWQKASRLLDLIFCNTVDYVPGWENSYDDWSRWLRSVQVETAFFYATPGVTYQDQNYLRMFERFDRWDAGSDLNKTRIAVPPAEEITWQIIVQKEDLTNGPYMAKGSTDTPTREGIRQGLQALAGIYRLADVYPPNTDDGLLLLRAAKELLPELVCMLGPKYETNYGAVINAVAATRFARQVAWLKNSVDELPAVRTPPILPDAPSPYPSDKVQGGILRPYDGVTDGCLCLLALDDAAAAQRLLEAMRPTTDDAEVEPDVPIVNIAFTVSGLRACGLPESQIDWFPFEFRQGMAARAGLLGDVRGNHPRRWKLPLLNWPAALVDPEAQAAADAEPVAMESIHVVVQVRLAAAAGTKALRADSREIIAQKLRDLVGSLEGVRPLSVEWLSRMHAGGQVVDHFGFTDGQSQPQFSKDANKSEYPNQVHLGEVLVGYDNAADHAGDLAANNSDDRRQLMRDGSFLVIRKLRQNVAVLDHAVQSLVDAEAEQVAPLSKEDVLAKMMGRWPASASGGKAGKPLIAPAGDINDFNYVGDIKGKTCPFGAHIRRANPRDEPPSEPAPLPGARPPRLMRRSLPYGPLVSEGGADADRGLMFMAYSASIAEQFEVVQRWLSGGNSSRGYSNAACPFLGVPESGRTRVFRFEHADRTIRLPLDGSDDLGADPAPIVQLQWGLYLFAPSTAALDHLLRFAQAASTMVAWSVDEGAEHIKRLRRLEHEAGADVAAQAWKAALEDPDAVDNFKSASIWAAIRSHHGGVLRIPYGVLVAERALVDQVLANRGGKYTVTGYQQRLEPTIGSIFLGLDDTADGEYRRQSRVCNEKIMALTFEDGFRPARMAAIEAIDGFVQDSIDRAKDFEETHWELNLDCRDVIDRVLARLCEAWFGLVSSEDGPFKAGGFDWNWKADQPALYPGHFISPSRYTFQPLPGEAVERLAVLHGTTLRAKMLGFLQSNHASITAPVTRAVIDQLGATSMDLVARTITGALMGFLPPADGNLRRIFIEWTRDGTLWSLRAQVKPESLDDWGTASSLLCGPLRRTMQLRPVPEQIWRTVVRSHRLGRKKACQVHVRPGDKVILALASATQQGLAEGSAPDVFPIFGGKRDNSAAQPTHACPAYKAAIGAMAGILSAVLDRSETLRPGPAPGILTYQGDLPAEAELVQFFGEKLVVFPAIEAASKGQLLAFGDSWFNHPNAGAKSTDLRVVLGARGWDTSEFQNHCEQAKRLAQMHDVLPTNTQSIYATVRRLVRAHAQQGDPLPRAILVDGGGNDVTDGKFVPVFCRFSDQGSPLNRIVDPNGSGIKQLLLDDFLNDMGSFLSDILQRLAAATQGEIPILVHAYDFPIPDGRPSFPLLCPPLQPCIKPKGYSDAQGIAIMRKLIEQLNDKYAFVVGQQPAASKVQFLRLTGTLESQPGFAANYKTYWANELHPTVKGFQALADVIEAQIP